jgi:N-methylhydantoinase A
VEAEDLEGVAGRFHAEHQRRYGYRMEDEVVELVNLRLIATVPSDKPNLPQVPPDREPGIGRRRASFDGAWQDTVVYRRVGLRVGNQLGGPAVVEFPESTLVIRPSWQATVDEVGTLQLERQR